MKRSILRRFGLVSATVALASGCGGGLPGDLSPAPVEQIGLAGSTTNHGTATLRVRPKVGGGGFKAQAVVTEYTSDDVAHLLIQVYKQDPETMQFGTTPVAEANVLNADLGGTVTFANLQNGATYQLVYTAFMSTSTGEVIINDLTRNSVIVSVGTDDQVTMDLTVYLAPKLFSGSAASNITFVPGGYTWTGSETISVTSPTPAPAPTATFQTGTGMVQDYLSLISVSSNTPIGDDYMIRVRAVQELDGQGNPFTRYYLSWGTSLTHSEADYQAGAETPVDLWQPGAEYDLSGPGLETLRVSLLASGPAPGSSLVQLVSVQ